MLLTAVKSLIIGLAEIYNKLLYKTAKAPKAF